MKNIGIIFKQDLRRMFTNIPTLIIIIALLVLPSLYAWFNIKANWDPYGSTGGIQVAIVNEDKGSDVLEEEMNIGNEVVAQLKKNDKLGWVFVDLEEAEYGVRSGKYYAYLKIPKDFTSSLKSVTEKKQLKPTLLYVINEKSNAIVPKITSSGVNSIKAQISQNIITTVNEVIFEAFNTLGFSLEESLPKIKNMVKSIIEVDANRVLIARDLDRYYEGVIKAQQVLDVIDGKLPLVEETLIEIGQVANQAQQALGETSKVLENMGDTVASNLSEVKRIANELSVFLEALNNQLDNSNALTSVLEDMKSAVETMKDLSEKTASLLRALGLPNATIDQLTQHLGDLENELIGAREAVINQKQQALEVIKRLTTEAEKTQQTVDESLAFFEDNLRPQIKDMLVQTTEIASQVAQLSEELTRLFPNIKEVETIGQEAFEKGEEVLATIKEQLPSLQATIHEFAQKLSFFQNQDEIDELLSLLESNPKLIAEYIASPVILKEKALYPIPNYGSAMAPFYTVLAIWVGIVLLSAMLTTESKLEGATLREVYIGKGLTYLVLALVQSLIVGLGDLYLLKVYVVNKGVFILLCLLSAIVFTSIIYTLVAVLGNLGKGITIILLVLQISSAGGTFPVEVIPPFFRGLSKVLPFTYAIDALREAQGGIFYPNLYRELSYLLGFFIIFIVIGLMLKKPLRKVHEFFNEKFKLSDLGE